MTSLKNRHIVITGATRGIGRGLALATAQHSANLYITGRTATGPDSLHHISSLITSAGGTCHYFVVDHSDDTSVADFFADLTRKLEANGATLDVFVNNAYSAVEFLTASEGVPFWNQSLENPGVPDPQGKPGLVWDHVNGVGLRNNYVCATYAMRIMERQGCGVIVNVSSLGGMMSIFDVAYCVGKSAVDRMTAEMARLAPPGIVCVTLWPGLVATEHMVDQYNRQKEGGHDTHQVSVTSVMWNAETPIFVGRVLSAMLAEKHSSMLKSMHGKIVVTAELGNRFQIADENGFRPLSARSLRFFLELAFPYLRNSPLKQLVPRQLYFPWGLFRRMFGNVEFWR